MFAKVLIRTAIATGAVAGAVHLIRKHDLVSKAGVAVNTAAEKAADGAQRFIAKGIGLTDELLTRFDEKTTDAPPAEKTSDLTDFLGAVEEARQVAQARATNVWTQATRENGQ